VNELNRNRWITQGIKIYTKRMQFLNGLKKNTNCTREPQDYINRYQVIYKRVIKEAKKRENNKYVTRTKNKIKAMWQIIKRSWEIPAIRLKN
jgi:hypothetical protein